MLQRAAQGRAFLDGRDFCCLIDFEELAVAVFSHRVVASSRHASLQKNRKQPKQCCATSSNPCASPYDQMQGDGSASAQPGMAVPPESTTSQPAQFRRTRKVFREQARTAFRQLRNFVQVNSTIAQLWAKADRPGVRAFFLSIAALGVALMLALYSGAAAEVGHSGLSIAAAVAALLVAGWVAITLVPILAKRTPLRWIGYKMEYKITREGWIYIGGIIIVALAALNTGNNLLFLILASLIAIILMSGILSTITLTGIGMRLQLPEHIFAGQAVRAQVELENEKLTLPSFSLRVEAVTTKKSPAAALLETPVYFPYVPKRERMQQSVPITFARRGAYRQDAFRIVTRFPFGFLQKARRVELGSRSNRLPLRRAIAGSL